MPRLDFASTQRRTLLVMPARKDHFREDGAAQLNCKFEMSAFSGVTLAAQGGTNQKAYGSHVIRSFRAFSSSFLRV